MFQFLYNGPQKHPILIIKSPAICLVHPADSVSLTSKSAAIVGRSEEEEEEEEREGGREGGRETSPPRPQYQVQGLNTIPYPLVQHVYLKSYSLPRGSIVAPFCYCLIGS